MGRAGACGGLLGSILSKQKIDFGELWGGSAA